MSETAVFQVNLESRKVKQIYRPKQEDNDYDDKKEKESSQIVIYFYFSLLLFVELQFTCNIYNLKHFSHKKMKVIRSSTVLITFIFSVNIMRSFLIKKN